MYNRYIPQPDGSYRRRSMPEEKPPQNQSQPQWNPPQSPCAPAPKEEPCPPPKAAPYGHFPRRPQYVAPTSPHREPKQEVKGNISEFLRNLIPKDFDTGDLMIILLLLLMAGDCQEDQNTALLTLALYFFL